MKARRELATIAGEFGTSLSNLATAEISPSLSNPLALLADVQYRIKELEERQNQQHLLTIASTINEYQRLVGSINLAISQRHKAFFNWQDSEAELQKRKQLLDKLRRQGNTQQDRLSQLGAEVSDGERKSHQFRLQFEEIGKLIKTEYEKFHRDQLEDFSAAVETFLEGGIETQKEKIEHWETLLMHFDQEEYEIEQQQQAAPSLQPPSDQQPPLPPPPSDNPPQEPASPIDEVNGSV